MKNIIKGYLLLIIFFSISCKRHLTVEETQTALKTAMQNFLDSQKNVDPSKVKFSVIGVEYFEDKTRYDCEFKVKMILTDHDTTGIMGASVSKDFSTVKRKF